MIKVKWIALGVLTLLIVFGIYNNPDPHNDEVIIEFQKELHDMVVTLTELDRKLIETVIENDACFKVEMHSSFDIELEAKERLDKCVTDLNEIQGKLSSEFTKNLAKYRSYYNDEQNEAIREKIELHRIPKYFTAYVEFMMAYDQFLLSYINGNETSSIQYRIDDWEEKRSIFFFIYAGLLKELPLL